VTGGWEPKPLRSPTETPIAPSPAEVGFIRLRARYVDELGSPEFGGEGLRGSVLVDTVACASPVKPEPGRQPIFDSPAPKAFCSSTLLQITRSFASERTKATNSDRHH